MGLLGASRCEMYATTSFENRVPDFVLVGAGHMYKPHKTDYDCTVKLR